MYIPKRLLMLGLSGLLLVASGAFAISALAGGGSGDDDRFRSALAPSVPSDPAIHGVTPGGVPWVLDAGSARVDGDGDVRVRMRGLVIPSPPGDNTPGGVETVSASLYCGADSETAPAGTTEAVGLDDEGDARIRDELELPAKCLAPVVLVHPNGNTARYIAATGLE